MIRILLVEDDEVFRTGIQMTLERAHDLELTGICTEGKMAIQWALQERPDVILMDLGLPGLNGIEATRQIKEKQPDIKIIALTSHSESQFVDEVLNAGADGFCLKGLSMDRLLSAIYEICNGTLWIDAGVSQQIKKRFIQNLKTEQKSASLGLTKRISLLTEREKEVLSHIAFGRTNQEIAELLNISHGTVRVHVHAVLNKLNVRDRTQAALLFREQGS